jgi:hypothetical protein
MRKIRITESKLIKIIEKILKEQYTDKREELKNFLLDSMNFEDYDDIDVTNPFKEGFNLFLEVMGHDIRRYGTKKAFIQYIMGIPNWINLPIYHEEIKDLMYALGYDEIKDKDMDTMDIQNLFYDEIFRIFVENRD